jgi:hypothetical protein
MWGDDVSYYDVIQLVNKKGKSLELYLEGAVQ